MTTSENEWDRRILCSDGNCIGIIGADGRCKVCGLPYDGELPIPAGDPHAAEEGVEDVPEEPLPDGEGEPVVDEPVSGPEASEDAWENRTLCIDGNCIGIVGPDGCCKTCGKPHPGKQS